MSSHETCPKESFTEVYEIQAPEITVGKAVHCQMRWGNLSFKYGWVSLPIIISIRSTMVLTCPCLTSSSESFPTSNLNDIATCSLGTTIFFLFFYLFFILFYYYFLNFYCYSVTVVCLFSPSLHPTPAELTSVPHLHCPPLILSMCPL